MLIVLSGYAMCESQTGLFVDDHTSCKLVDN